MPKAARLNFTVPEDVAELLKERVTDRKRSSFVAVAIREKLLSLEREQLEKELIEGYSVRREEAAAINAEWEYATLENWPD